MKNSLSQRSLRAVVLVFFASFVFFACSGADPVIYRLNWTLQAVFNPSVKNKVDEQLVIHILADDEDGFEELYELYVIHDESDLYWRVTSDEWSEFSVDDKTWIGVNAVKREAGVPLLRGNYRVLLRDLSGYEDEKKFTLSSKVARYTRASFPKMRFEQSNGYIPVFATGADVTESVGLLQLMYPEEDEGTIENGNTGDVDYIRSSLGDNGVLYRVESGKKITFTSDASTRFSVYLHHRQSERLLLSTGPYKISLEK